MTYDELLEKSGIKARLTSFDQLQGICRHCKRRIVMIDEHWLHLSNFDDIPVSCYLFKIYPIEGLFVILGEKRV